MMPAWRRLVSAVGGGTIIALFGGLFVTLAIGRALVQATGGAPGTSILIVSLFIGGPGLVLLYGGYQLPRSDVRREFHPTVAIWCMGGFGVMLGILTIYNFMAMGGIANPDRAVPILTSLSSVAGFGVGVHDAQAKTRTRETEETVERLRTSNERLEQFAYAASHDLQEPLRMVSSYLQLIEQRYDETLDDDGREFLTFAVEGADRMRRMIDELLAYSRVESQGKSFEPVELDDVLENVRTDLEIKIEERGAEITTDTLPRIDGDAEQLHQVFLNLLDNAIEYSGNEPPQVAVSAEQNGTEWTVSVRDEGVGIEPEDHDRIFEVFNRLHSRGEYPGTGIGLATCERIIERHGGEIWVDSEAGEGATFSFTVPRVTEPRSA